jgi:hypothetical protein
MIAAQQKFAAAFGREIALVKLFAHPTIRGFAAFLAEDDAGAAQAAAVVAEAIETRHQGASRLGQLRRRHQAGAAS